LEKAIVSMSIAASVVSLRFIGSTLEGFSWK